MLNLSIVLEESALRRGSLPAFRFGEDTTSFAELEAAACSIAAGIREKGIEPGERIALSCPNVPWFPIVYFGILKAGCSVVPLNVLLTASEVAYHLEDSLASAYFCFEGTPELPMGKTGAEAFASTPNCRHFLKLPNQQEGVADMGPAESVAAWLADYDGTFESVSTHADDTAVILYTSGTTGRPKGAELSHSNIFMNAMVCVDMMQMEPSDTQLLVLPLFHSFGQVVQLVSSALAGCSIVLVPRFDPAEVIRLLDEQEVTFFAGVPTMYWALLHTDVDEDVRSRIGARLRLAVSGGASLPVQVLKAFEEKFDVPILEGYGLSESSPVACFNQLDRERKPGSIGSPIWGVQMRLRTSEGQSPPDGEPGEVQIRGHNVMKGYFNRPEATAETIQGGWLSTGDVAHRDSDGYYFIVDRTKDMIIRGGFNVYPREIEEVLMEHPSISLVSVIGVPHEEYGEEIKAFVVASEGQTVDSDELIGWSKERLAAYKYPRIVEFRDALPMNATGKVLKRELRQLDG